MSSDARRAQLLAAAREVFARQGFHGTSMDAVADEAGITKPVLYQHFASKRDLFLELLDDMRERLVYELDHVPRPSSPEELLAAGVESFFRFVAGNAAAFRLMFEASAGDAEVAKRVQVAREEIVERVLPVVAAVCGPVDGEIAAWAMVGMSERVSHWWLDHPSSSRSAEELASLVARMAWWGLSASDNSAGSARGEA
jgi:AcrR family transcriptional regulator